MPDSVEQQIIDQVVERMQTISVANGYQTNIGANVRDSETHWDETELPATSIFEGIVTSEDQDDEGYLVMRTMPVMIKVFLKRISDAAANAAYARKVLADIRHAIRTDPHWSVAGAPLANGTSEKTFGIEYAPESFEITGTQFTAEIRYISQAFA